MAEPKRLSFTLAGRQFELAEDLVRARLTHHRPEVVQQYWVEIDGVRWPVKQVMALATGLDRNEFQSQNSRRLLAKLGFPIGKGNAVLPASTRSSARATGAAEHSRQQPPPLADVLLVGCVKTKRDKGAPAKDLYTSDYFSKMRAYAENSELPWFILSAEHGLVSPETWLEPYDCYLPDMSREYRDTWGAKVAVQLEQAIGPLVGVTVDIHAGSVYVESAEAALKSLGAIVIDQLEGLSFGRRLSWYLSRGAPTSDAQDLIARLREASSAATLNDVLATRGNGLQSPGMYSWWVDEAGAVDLSRGLGHQIDAGLIYAGLAGATRKGGASSSNTLWGRIATMHLGKKHEFSTLRRSLGSILAHANGQSAINEEHLTLWMHAHLRVVLIPVANADTLDDRETEVLAELDPPLNLAKVARTPLRQRLSALRKHYAGATPSRSSVGSV